MNGDDKGGNVTALAVRQDQSITAGGQWRWATDIAGAVRDFVLANIVMIQGKRYPPVVAWQAIANTAGCVGSCAKVERVEGGWLATGEVRRMSDGVVIATGFGFAGNDEKASWVRAEFSILSMAQTRSIGRACRSAFAAVLPIIDKGLETCSAEEMPAVDGAVVERNGRSRTDALKEKVKSVVGSNAKRPSPPEPVAMSDFADEPSPDEQQEIQDDENFVFPFGSEKDQPLSAVSDKSLKFGIDALGKSIGDPAKAKYREGNDRLRNAMARELQRRGAKR